MIRKFTVTNALDTAVVATGEVVIAPTELTNLNPVSGGGIILDHITLLEEGGQMPGLLFLFFDTLPAGTWTVNADPVPSNADMAAYVGGVEIDTNEWALMGAVAWLDTDKLDKLMLASSTGSLWFTVLARSQYDAVATDDLNVNLFFTSGPI